MTVRFKRAWCLIWLAAAACASSDSPADDDAPSAPETETPESSPEIERPENWDESTHSAGVQPDYERLFSTHDVHRIDIAMSPSARAGMLEDLEKLLGAPSSGGGPGMGPMGMGGGFPQPPAEWFTACEGKQATDSCEANASAGNCRDLAGRLLCLPMNVLGGMGGMGGPPGGAVDLVPEDPMYVPVTIRYDGREWTQVAMRFKGNSSLASAWRQGVLKIGFRLHFDRLEVEHPEIANQRFFGFRELTFSSGWNDPALIRDTLAGEVFRSHGLPTARTAFYRVYVDAGDGPVYWGLYTMIEDPSDAMLAEHFENSDGNLYKPDGAGADFTSFVEEGFVKKTNERAADYTDVRRAIDALHASRDDAAKWRANLEAVFDVPTFLRTVAVSRAIGHWDGYGRMSHNYYLYGDPSHGGRLTWISWDHNLAWQPSGGFFGDLTPMMDEVTDRWPLIRYLMDDEVYRSQYQTELEGALSNAYVKETFDARARELHELVAPYVLGEGDADPEATPFTHLRSPDTFRSAIDAASTGLITIADQRHKDVREALANE